MPPAPSIDELLSADYEKFVGMAERVDKENGRAAVHSAYIRASRSAGFTRARNPGAYFWRIVRNELVDRHRFKPPTPFPLPDTGIPQDPPDILWMIDCERRLEARFATSRQPTVDPRRVAALRMSGYGVQEIADLFDVGVGTIKMHLMRMRWGGHDRAA